MIKYFVENYLEELKKCIDEVPIHKVAKITNIIYNAYKNKKQVFIMGNGGSAATSSHFACDLGKGTATEKKNRFRVISLNDNTPLMTALANDLGYEMIFKEQLMNLLEEGDVVIVLTCSGNSENILKAVEYAKKCNAISVGLIGSGGGKLKNLVDEEITFSTRHYGLVEDLHLIISHITAYYFIDRVKNGNTTVFIDKETFKNQGSFDQTRVSEAFRLFNEYNIPVITLMNYQDDIKKTSEVKLQREKQDFESLPNRKRTYFYTQPYSEDSEFKAMKQGLLMEASKDFDLNLSNCFFIGSSSSDIEAGSNVGCKTILVNKLIRPGEREDRSLQPSYVAENIFDAAETVITEYNKQIKESFYKVKFQ